uniref:Uncharacterized protein n=1 Tax=Tanacetum cinerariifolium TaxID=118510 RepID=A0A6L2M8J6_TANCI|nr:hypothetical protein [Tanacetum cinerariifolium]
MDDHMFTTCKLVSRHQNTQQFGAILPVELTNEAIKNSKSYKEYYAIASGAEPPKTKASIRKKQSSSKTTMPPLTATGKRLKTLAKVGKPAKEKQPAKSSKAKGLTVLSEVALTEAEQMKLAIKRSLTQTHISHASESGTDEGTGILLRVPDVPTYESDDEEISWKSSEDDDDDKKINDQDDDDDDDEQTDSDNDGDDFVHPKFFTHDEEDKDEESFDPIVQTPSQVENTDDEENDEDSHGMNVEGDKMDDEGANEEDESNELYRDVNINLAGQQQSSSVSSRFVSDMLNLSPDTGIDSIFDSTLRVDVPVTTTTEPPLLSVTTLPSPSIPIISHMQQTPAPSPENEQVKEHVKVQVSKILPNIEKTINEQLEAEVLTHSSNSSKTSHAVAADLSELELKKILIDKMESKKSIDRSNEQKNLYKALVDTYECDKLILDTYGDTVALKRPLVDTYECDKLILDTYGDTVALKRRRDDEDKDEEPSAGSNRGSKRRRARKEPDSTSAPKAKTSKTPGKSTEGSKSHHKTASESAPAEEPMHTTQDLEEPTHQEFETSKPPTPDRAWNKTLPVTHGRIQPWINNLAKKADSRTSFNELMDNHVDFSAFVMNRLKVDTLTPELLASPTYELMKGSCKSLVELEFFLEEVYKATTDQLDWNNPKGHQYPHGLLKPLPLIPNSRGRRVIPFDHFINNDLEYLRGGASSQKYTTLVTKTKATDYGHIKWIEDLVPHIMWIQVPVSYDKHALWGIRHWGRKRQQFYRFTVNRESARDVYSKCRIIAVTKLQIVEWHDYKHLDWITVCRDDDKIYKFKEGDFKRLRIQDIKDMLLLV